MREIKFRGRHVRTGEWQYGSLLASHIIGTVKEINRNGSGYTAVITEFTIVDPETVGQFIGHTDRNSKEIYEGDIVIDPTRNKIVMWRSAIEWADTGFGLSTMHPAERDLWELYERNRLEVIGDIHTNPDLIR